MLTDSSVHSSEGQSEAGDDNIKSTKRPNNDLANDLFNLGLGPDPGPPSGHGVWMTQNSSAPQSKSRPVRSVAPSVVSSTGTAWDNFERQEHARQPGTVDNRSSTQAGGRKDSSKWAKQNAVKPEKGTLLAAQKIREDQRRVQEQERARYDDDDDDDGSDWEP